MTAAPPVSVDAGVDDQIFACVDLDKPTSFLLFAGAGSGKTRSLVNVLERIRDTYTKRLWLRGQRIAVITYTNAACDEIKQRLKFNALFEISTIHSFAWSLIGSYHEDIREWLSQNLRREIEELHEAQRKGKPGTKTAIDREMSISDKTKRLSWLDKPTRFVYSPTGDNRGRSSLNHSEVIALASFFLTNKPMLQNVIVNQFPVLFIDECQDTNKHLMDALLAVQQAKKAEFCLGLFGDVMQRIYADGKVGLAEALPSDWARPAKLTNYRCSKRVLKLINQIRLTTDGQQQIGPTSKSEGAVRLFVLRSSTDDKQAAELNVARRMADITKDPMWSGDRRNSKTLILEHHMAARRMGFLEMFEALYAADRLRTGLLDGSLAGLRLFTTCVLPVLAAKRSNDDFGIAAVIRKESPLLDKLALKAAGSAQLGQLRRARDATSSLLSLWDNPTAPTFMDVLKNVAESRLFAVPDSLRPISNRLLAQGGANAAESDADDEDEADGSNVLAAWEKFLLTPFEQVVAYTSYVGRRAEFDTHQGVKGREFPRVSVIVDDEEARGFMFSYEKLFGAKPKSDADLKNEKEGKETSLALTKRLFYVTCSRAEESLAIIAYTNDPEGVRRAARAERWFDDNEIEMM